MRKYTDLMVCVHKHDAFISPMYYLFTDIIAQRKTLLTQFIN